MTCSNNTIELNITAEGHYKPAYQAVNICLPSHESRQLLINGEEAGNGDAFPLSQAYEQEITL